MQQEVRRKEQPTNEKTNIAYPNHLQAPALQKYVANLDVGSKSRRGGAWMFTWLQREAGNADHISHESSRCMLFSKLQRQVFRSRAADDDDVV